MKNLLATIALFVIIVGISTVSVKYLNNMCASLLTLNSKIETSIKNESWEAAKKNINTFYDEWDRHSSLVSIYIHHMELDDISIELEKLSQSIDYEEKKDAMEASHTLKFQLNHIRELEKINLQNVF